MDGDNHETLPVKLNFRLKPFRKKTLLEKLETQVFLHCVSHLANGGVACRGSLGHVTMGVWHVGDL